MPQRTLGGIPGCVAPELLLANLQVECQRRWFLNICATSYRPCFADGVTKVVETHTAGLGLNGPTPEASSRGNMRRDTFFDRHSYRL